MIENHLKTGMLLALLTALVLWIGSLWSTVGLVVALVIVLAMNVGSYWYSDKIVLKMYSAQEAPKNSKLHQMVEEVAKNADIPMPKVYIVPQQHANAFATGRNPEHAAIACTEGIMNLLSDEELKGVIAHEAAHIKNRDTLITTIAATIAGVISYAATMAQWAMIFGGRDQDGGEMVQLLVMAILAPVLATILQLAISRSREYLADASGAKFVGSGNALADALAKLESQGRQLKHGNEATSSLFIVNPFSKSNLAALLSTHPSTKERIKRLRSL